VYLKYIILFFFEIILFYLFVIYSQLDFSISFVFFFFFFLMSTKVFVCTTDI